MQPWTLQRPVLSCDLAVRVKMTDARSCCNKIGMIRLEKETAAMRATEILRRLAHRLSRQCSCRLKPLSPKAFHSSAEAATPATPTTTPCFPLTFQGKHRTAQGLQLARQHWRM